MMGLHIDIEFNQNDFALSCKADVNAGITGLFGPSGSGKTTLLHIIAGLVQPDSGSIRLNDTLLYNSNFHHLLPVQKRQIGLVFQDHLLFPHLTVEGNLRFGQNKKCKERKRQLCDIAELLEITHLLNRNVKMLSGGEKQRVALGRAILSSPQLLLLDEPFTGLDQDLKRQLIPCMKNLHKKTHIPMIFVSHNREELAALAEELFFIEDGKLLAQAKLHKAQSIQPVHRFCNADGPTGFQKTRNLLIRNQSLSRSG